MSIYQIVGIALLALPIIIGFVGFLCRWSKLAPQHVEPHGRAWGRSCPRCQGEEFAPTGDGRHKCARCGHVFI